MRILILGANGFIGKHLVRKLLAQDNLIVTGFSRHFDPDITALKKHGLRLIVGDFHSPLDLAPALRGQDIVYHLISESVASSSWNNPLAEIESNLVPTIKLLQLCVDLSISKVVFASSAGTVYGKREALCREEDALRPFSPYGITKSSIEYFLEYFRVKAGLDYSVYRISNPYGPGLDKPGFGVINTWLGAALHNQPITIYGDGSASKDYLYIDDLIHFLDLAREKTGGSEILNVASGEISSLTRILDCIRSTVPHELNVNHIAGNPGDNTTVRIANEKLLGDSPDFKFVSLEDGIRRTYEHMISS